MCNIENGKIDPRLSTVKALADAIGVDVDDLVDGKRAQSDSISRSIAQHYETQGSAAWRTSWRTGRNPRP